MIKEYPSVVRTISPLQKALSDLRQGVRGLAARHLTAHPRTADFPDRAILAVSPKGVSLSLRPRSRVDFRPEEFVMSGEAGFRFSSVKGLRNDARTRSAIASLWVALDPAVRCVYWRAEVTPYAGGDVRVEDERFALYGRPVPDLTAAVEKLMRGERGAGGPAPDVWAVAASLSDERRLLIPAASAEQAALRAVNFISDGEFRPEFERMRVFLTSPDTVAEAARRAGAFAPEAVNDREPPLGPHPP